MGITGRSYSDPAYGVKQTIRGDIGAIALNGTVTSTTTKGVITVMQPCTVIDFNAVVLVAGTAVDTKLLIGKSLAGTGAFSPFGTITLTGTQNAATVIDASVTSTAFSTGDDIVLSRAAGTETEAALRVDAYIQYAETFEAADN